MKKKTIIIHQPYFLPWLGFFDKIAQADIFIILSEVQCDYRSQSVLNRNLIKTSNGKQWLTVPIKAGKHTKISEVQIDNSQNWRERHLKTLFLNYKKALNFQKIYPKIEQIYQKKYDKLIDLNLTLISFAMKELKITTIKIMDSKLKVSGQKNELLVNLIKSVDGNVYLSGLGAKDYLDKAKFKKAGLEVEWQKFTHPRYPQLWGEFIPNLSVIDYLFCADFE